MQLFSDMVMIMVSQRQTNKRKTNIENAYEITNGSLKLTESLKHEGKCQKKNGKYLNIP